jgi:hypothetical protein
VRGDDSIWKDSIEGRDERTMKVRLLDKFEKAFQDSAQCICTGPFGIDLRGDDLSETSATAVEFVVDNMGTIGVVAQAAAASTAMVLTAEQRRLSTKLLSGMADGVLGASSLRTLLNLAERKDATDATGAPKPSAPVTESAAAAPAEPQCGMSIYPIDPPPQMKGLRKYETRRIYCCPQAQNQQWPEG